MMFNGKSPFQKVQIIESCFGKTLVLDSKTQSAEFDEHIYHESLVHPALLTHPEPKTVFIGGGGEYATAREVLRHPSVERCVMVDIDEKVCKICEEELPEWGNGCTKDPRLEVVSSRHGASFFAPPRDLVLTPPRLSSALQHYDDAYGFLERDTRSYDVVIMDIADPIEAGPGIALCMLLHFYFVHLAVSHPLSRRY